MEKMPRGIIRSTFFEPWREEAGLSPAPAYFALRAQRLMMESDVRLEDLARVSEKNHRHGVDNPYAMYQKALSVEEILASPVVCEPLRLLMLCAPNEGAAAVVLSAHPAPVRVSAAALRSHHAGSVLGEHTPLSGLAGDGVPTPTEMAARDAHEAAGVGRCAWAWGIVLASRRGRGRRGWARGGLASRPRTPLRERGPARREREPRAHPRLRLPAAPSQVASVAGADGGAGGGAVELQ